MPVNVTSFEGIDLTEDQVEILRALRDYVDRDVLPHVREYEEPDEFPEAMVQSLREMGAFGMRIPEEYGGMGLDLVTYALAIAELSRGWTTISGIVTSPSPSAPRIWRSRIRRWSTYSWIRPGPSSMTGPCAG